MNQLNWKLLPPVAPAVRVNRPFPIAFTMGVFGTTTGQPPVIVTVTEASPTLPQLFVALTTYVVVEEGLTLIVCPVPADGPELEPTNHWKVNPDPPVAFAVKENPPVVA